MMIYILQFTILVLLPYISLAVEPNFNSVLVNVPEMQENLVHSLSDTDIRALQSTNHCIQEIMESPYLLQLRIRKLMEKLIIYYQIQNQKSPTTVVSSPTN